MTTCRGSGTKQRWSAPNHRSLLGARVGCVGCGEDGKVSDTEDGAQGERQGKGGDDDGHDEERKNGES